MNEICTIPQQKAWENKRVNENWQGKYGGIKGDLKVLEDKQTGLSYNGLACIRSRSALLLGISSKLYKPMRCGQ